MIEVWRAEYQFFDQEQRQLEQYSTRRRPDACDVQLFCLLQAGFRARQQLFKLCIVTNEVKPSESMSHDWIVFVAGVPANSSQCFWARNFRWEVRHQSGPCDNCRRWSAWRLALDAGFRGESTFHSEELLFGLRYRYVDRSCDNLWQHHK